MFGRHLKDRIEELKKDIAYLETVRDAGKFTLERLAKELREKDETIKNGERQLAQSLSQIHIRDKELEALNLRITDLRCKLSAKGDEVTKLRAALGKRDGEIADLAASKAKLQLECSDLGARLVSLTMRVASAERSASPAQEHCFAGMQGPKSPMPPENAELLHRICKLERLHATPDNMELTPEVLREDLDELSEIVAFDREALQKVCAAVGIEVVARDPAEQLDVFPATHVEKCDDCGGAKIKKGHK